MPILNYTTTVEVQKSMGEVIGKLVGAGAFEITTVYENKMPMAVMFVLETPQGARSFRLPSNSAGIKKVLASDPKTKNTAKNSIEQAERIGWRILKDWVEVQIATVEAQMTTLDQIMLPYMLVAPDKTLYEQFALKEIS